MTAPSSQPEEDQDLGEVLAELWKRFKPSIIGQVEVLEEAVHELGASGLSEPTRRHAEGEAHKLAGSLGSFGFPHGTVLARELELSLAAHGGPAISEAPHLAEQVRALRRELDSRAGADPGGDGEETSSDNPALLLVGTDYELVERLSFEAQGRSFRPISAATSAAARRLAATQRPRAAVLDLSFAEDAEDDLGLLEDLARHEPPVHVLVLTRGEALIDRVEVARRGGRGFLARARPLSQVIDAVSEAVERLEAPQAKLLAVDDDSAFVGVLEAVLAPHGLAVTTINDPLGFWEALEEVRPDILLLDLDMPGLDGVDLCQALRADARFAQVPVLFLTVLTDAASVQRIFEAGADDYVSKPLVESELLTRINNRLERVRLLRQLADRDSLTGLASRRAATTRIEDFLAMSDRFGEPVALAFLDLDDFKRLNDDLGHAAGDAALRRVGELFVEASRSEDVIGRWGGEEFVIGMFGMARDDGVRRVRQLLEIVREQASTGGGRASLSFSAGVAEYPRDGRNLHQLYLAADKALYTAKAAGRGHVLAVESRVTAPPQGVDGVTEGGAGRCVLIVEDNPVNQVVAEHMVRKAGYQTELASNGRVGLEAMERRSFTAVLMDCQMPELDGYMATQEIRRRESGTDRRTPVIALTAHAMAGDRERAYAAGMDDYLTKPASFEVLASALRRWTAVESPPDVNGDNVPGRPHARPDSRCRPKR